MDIAAKISSYNHQALSYHLVKSILSDYKRPNDKIHELLKTGILTSIKKGLYIAGPHLKLSQPEPFLIANHLWGPSYISLESALSYYGLIPETVFGITSITVKNARTFSTPVGIFSYVRMRVPWYAYGIQQLKLSDDQYCMIASPEKAICDLIINTSGAILRSRKNVLDYLTDELRMDIEILKSLDIGMINGWIDKAPKKTSIEMFAKSLKHL